MLRNSSRSKVKQDTAQLGYDFKVAKVVATYNKLL
jgi:hypothetical protein